ncbi:hypothetical protein BJF93_06315 [Xaviernesmea oryzae]|uniref:DUF2948 family protein n=1 Tax=Xaviernesmea oryzae TaxID=464029 RepID=A0A1Q9AS12_9HYPH|nr:DUF2948 family protein [Xaviernesmea oryzae]OLP58232.1 hypothetical protein BJF93_06315 [Xaviernesmea oryzae]SEL45679.1 Protein of unknown function [Xaviernesmea oryzae]
MDALKLMALDEEDLAVISAHVQDAVFKLEGIAYRPSNGHFTLVLNRFVWEKALRSAKTFERRRAAITFKRVRAVRSLNLDRQDTEAVHVLLAIRFDKAGEGPDGTVELLLAGGATIALDVECIELQLAETGGAWETSSRPRHDEA